MSSLIISFLRGRFVLCIGRVRAQGCVVLGVEDYFVFSSFFMDGRLNHVSSIFKPFIRASGQVSVRGWVLSTKRCGHGRGSGLDMCLEGLVVR